MFGQYSSQFAGRKTKRDMVDGAKRRHPDSTILDARKAANNTLAYRVAESGVNYVALHDTDILSWCDGGTVTVDTGGFNTGTTRDRINGFGRRIGVTCFTSKGVLHVNGVPCHRRAWVDPSGKVKTDMPERSLKRLSAELDAFMAAWRANGLPPAEDAGGDPWIFTGSQMTEDVMRDWVRSRYIFRSFYGMALAFAGMQPAGVAMSYAMADRRGGKLDKLDLSRIRRFARRHIGLA